jgi:hypothetical protein
MHHPGFWHNYFLPLVKKRMKILLIFYSALFFACNNSRQPTVETLTNGDSLKNGGDKTVAVPVKDTTITGCFTQISKRDTAILQLDAKGITITGPLSYNYYQKDRNGGTIQGEISGDQLVGWYLFRSEGVMSMRQVAWKIHHNELWPAIGEMKERNDSMLFVNPDNLRYDSTHPFVKVACVM